MGINTITNILNNPIYKGYFFVQSKVKKEEIISPKVEQLETEIVKTEV